MFNIASGCSKTKVKFPMEPRYRDRQYYILSDINVRQPLFKFGACGTYFWSYYV
jgi:hypothetical protein